MKCSAADAELFRGGGHVAVCCCKRLGDQSSFRLMQVERARVFAESLGETFAWRNLSEPRPTVHRQGTRTSRTAALLFRRLFTGRRSDFDVLPFGRLWWVAVKRRLVLAAEYSR
jgi:hypothetical protein